MDPLAPPRRLLRPMALLATLALALWGLATPTAGAHGDEGEMTVVTLEETAPQTVTVEVGLVHAGDDHLAEGAEVWVVARTDSLELDPVGLGQQRADSSVYSAELRLPEPGAWSFDFESTGPAATATGELEVTGATAPVPTSTIAPTTSTLLLDGDDGIADADDATGEQAATDTDAEDDDGLSAVVIALGVIGLLVLLAAGFALAQRRRSTTPDGS